MLLTLLLAAWSPASAQAPSVKNPDTFVYLTAGDASSMDPAWDGDTPSQEIILNLYDYLFAFNGASTDRLLPRVAERVPSRSNGLISPDGTLITIPIRKGIRFHDGTPLTPEDVRYSLMRFMIMDAGPAMMLLDPLAGYHTTLDSAGKLRPTVYRDADRAVQVDGDKIVLRLPHPFPPLLPILARWCPVVSKKWAVAHGDWDGTAATWAKFNGPKKETSPFFEKENGSGPFTLERWDRKTGEVVLARDENYWRGRAKLEKVVVRAVSDFSTRKLMLQAGDADAIAADRTMMTELRDVPGIRIIDGLTRFIVSPALEFCFRIELKGNPYVGSGKLDGDGVPADFFTDKDVRKAFAYSFDYDGYIRDVLRGQGTQATGFIPRGMFGYNPRQTVYRLDLEKAKRHFRQAFGGAVWDKGFRLSLLYSAGDAYREAAAQIVKRNVESLNPKFKIDVRKLDWPSMMDALDRQFAPLQAMGRYAPYPDPHALAFQFLESYPAEQCHYSNPASDRLVEAALRELNTGNRLRLYRQLLELEHEQVPFVPIADAPDFRVQRAWVKGWAYNPMIPLGGLFYSISKQN